MLLTSVKAAFAVALTFTGLVDAASYAIPGTFTGVNPQTRSRPARRNIIDLMNNDYFAFGLYISAIQSFQNTPTSAEDSYWQIAGIHGRPYISWDASFGPGGVSYATGYCEHDSILFPTWHRPYLALFEQRVHTFATNLANTATGRDRQKWLDAATYLRLPFWDWASDHNIPQAASSQYIAIKVPSKNTATGSTWVTVKNPLYTYKMPYLDPNLFPRNDPNDGQLAGYSFTVRQPSSTASNAASHDDQSNTALSRLNLKGNIYNLLTSNVAYYQMASQNNPGISLESIHGSVHVAVGGNGHMTQLGYAAFDPIFWLHHANCDRLFAIWEAINPNSWIPGSGEPAAWTFTNNGNGRDYSNTGLSPFSKNSGGQHWTSDSSRNLAAFGYTYPEINDWSQNQNQIRNSVVAAVNKLYGPNSGSNKRRKRQNGGADGEGETTQWYASVSVLKNALASGFTVSLFLGAPPASSLDFLTAANLAGTLSVFPPPSGLPVSPTMTSYTELSLDKALQAAGFVNSDDIATAAYLATNLVWRITKHDLASTPVDPATVPSLNVTVYEKTIVVPDSVFTLPTYSAPKGHPEITKGKSNGGGGGVGTK